MPDEKISISLRWKNIIRFNCKRYTAISILQPPNCYNCAYRDGYPQNLGGDEDCVHFLPKMPEKPEKNK
jgi:hypothetical protein